jgi:ribosomal protein S18 acetylase RimI-like enzyme
VLGDLIEFDERRAVVQTTSGPVEIELGTITAARKVEASTAQQLALERTANAGWAAAEQEWLGGWLLRANDGWTQRANSALPLRTPGRPMADMLAAVAQWYRARGLPPRICVPLPARQLLDAFLADTPYREATETATGIWRPGPHETDVLTARLPGPMTQPPDGRVEVSARPTPQWLAIARGGTIPAAGAALLARHDRAAFVCVHAEDGHPAAAVRGVVDEQWLGISSLEVDPRYRGAGNARRAMAAVTQWGAAVGATRAYLQVRADNTAVADWYERLGYHRHHRYRYWQQEGGRATG